MQTSGLLFKSCSLVPTMQPSDITVGDLSDYTQLASEPQMDLKYFSFHANTFTYRHSRRPKTDGAERDKQHVNPLK